MAEPTDTAPRDVILAALLRMHRSGESYEMGARWIMEDLRKAGFEIVPVTVEGDVHTP
jgi:hypothetical protein